MADIELSDGATTFTGKGIDAYRLMALKGALRIHKLGMKIRNVKPMAVAKSLGFTGKNVDEMISQVQAAIDNMRGKLTVSQE